MSNSILYRIRLLVLILISAVIVRSGRATHADQKPPTGKLVYAALSSGQGNNYEIFSINTDGSQKTQLTFDSVQDWAPAWSPDGKRIAYYSNKDNNTYHVYVINADGSDVTQLTDQSESTTGIAWSPDGKRIAFTSQRDGNDEIYVINADGTRPVRLTNNPARDVYPSWSVDGNSILFSSLRGDPVKGLNWQLYVMSADGTHLKSLTGDFATSHSYARYSPDGTRVADAEVHYSQDGSSGVGGINILSLTGKGKFQLPYSGTFDSPAWSPDGKYVAATHRAFNPDRSVRVELYILGVDTNEQYPVVTEGNPEVPNWSPAQ